MATLILGGLGTLFGGPISGALGALAGRQIDSAIVGSSSREGPRLDDLTISTSSYGTPIPRHYGTMRATGSIIWATDLVENSESSGGKGRPKVTTYSYSTSFAVALSSRPIRGIGRIWADGNLLRGSAGDLKTGGEMRLYPGHGDQGVDPLIASDRGEECPGFRNLAYVVFEALDLGDFGNRIPALSFEVFADESTIDIDRIVAPHLEGAFAAAPLTGMAGISYAGGELGSFMEQLSELYPIACDASHDRLALRAIPAKDVESMVLPEAAVDIAEDEFGHRTGVERQRSDLARAIPGSIRYYDPDRDYQPSVQRRSGREASAGETALEFPATLPAQEASRLIEEAAKRSSAREEVVRWRMVQLDPSIRPGVTVALPGMQGRWLVRSWEWRASGVELELVRLPGTRRGASAATSGTLPSPRDFLPEPTLLRALEMPWDGTGDPMRRSIFVAGAGAGDGWRGANLYAENGGALEPVATLDRTPGIFGTLAEALAPSPGIVFEQEASLIVFMAGTHMVLDSTDMRGIAEGRNRLMVGSEMLQFLEAERLGDASWRMTGLLRGRGGTEPAALSGHAAGTDVLYAKSALTTVEDTDFGSPSVERLAAIGRGDAQPVMAEIGNAGLSQRPLMPVHGLTSLAENGDLHLGWTRRARGAWRWDRDLEVRLNEDFERYEVGIGPQASPSVLFETPEPNFVLPAQTIAQFAKLPVWVRQVGLSDRSPALVLANLP